jgi:hypothetical protein
MGALFPATTFHVTLSLSVPPRPSATEIIVVYPATVSGVPVMAPELGSIDKPDGRSVADQERVSPLTSLAEGGNRLFIIKALQESNAYKKAAKALEKT